MKNKYRVMAQVDTDRVATTLANPYYIIERLNDPAYNRWDTIEAHNSLEDAKSRFDILTRLVKSDPE